MSKIDVGVGEDFPINDGQTAEKTPGEAGSDDDHRRACREEREARRTEWRSRRHAFGEDVRRAAHKHFGDHPFDHGGLWRVLIGVALLALAIAILPHLFLFAALVLTVVFFVAHRRGFYHHHTMPRHDADS